MHIVKDGIARFRFALHQVSDPHRPWTMSTGVLCTLCPYPLSLIGALAGYIRPLDDTPVGKSDLVRIADELSTLSPAHADQLGVPRMLIAYAPSSRLANSGATWVWTYATRPRIERKLLGGTALRHARSERRKCTPKDQPSICGASYSLGGRIRRIKHRRSSGGNDQ